MASIAIVVGAAIVNAVAFTAGNALYDKFGRSDGSEERIRHDKAVEDLQKASTDWGQKRLETLHDLPKHAAHSTHI
jgi:cytochrome c2